MDKIHDEVGTAGFGFSGVQHFGDVGCFYTKVRKVARELS